MTCKAKGQAIKIHDAIKELVIALAREAGYPVEKEKLHLLLDHPEHPGRKPADLYIRLYKTLRDLAIDTSIASVFDPAQLANAATKVGHSIMLRENAKNEKFRADLDRHGIDFMPFVMSIYGGMGRKAHNLLHDFATQISRLNETEAAAELQRLYTCLSNTLQSRLAQGILDRLPPEHRSFL